MVSINRPSRALRESATTMRYVGCFLLPRRASRIAVAIGHLLPLSRVPEHLERILGHAARAKLLHHLLHLLELGKQVIHSLDVGARTGRDAPAAAAVDPIRLAALFSRHGRDDSLDLVEGLFVHLQPLELGRWNAGDHTQEARERPHLPDLLDLFKKVVERKRALAKALLQL